MIFLMRPYSDYLRELKSETFGGKYNLSGSTPMLIPQLARASIRVSVDLAKYPEQLSRVEKFLAKANGCAPENITLVPGSTQACWQTLAAITQPGDGIIIEYPGYEPYLAAAKFLGLNILRFQRGRDMRRDFSELQSLAKSAKVLLLSNPHCPTGWTYGADDLARLRELKLLVVIDEVFLPLFTKGKISLRPLLPADENFIFLSGLTKSTGLSVSRLGWVVAAPAHAKAVRLVGLHVHTAMPQPLVQVMEYAFKNWKTITGTLSKIADANRKQLLEFAAAHPGVFSHDLKTGFFTMMRVPPEFKDAAAFTRELLDHEIFVRDGAHFEMPQDIRIKFSMPKRDFAAAFARIASYY